MATTEFEVQLPALDATQSIEVASFTATNLATNMKLKEAMKNKNNSLAIVVNCTTAGTVTLKAGDNYPNAILGDLNIAVAQGVNVIRLEDISRFENRDGSINITSATAVGTIFATAKRAGITPAEQQ